MFSVFPLYDLDNDSFRVQQLNPEGVEMVPLPGDIHLDALASQSDADVRNWLDGQIESTSCVVVFIGENTAGRRWITYVIGKARELGKPMVGVAIHALADENGAQANAGESPFANSGMSARALSQIETYSPAFATSVFVRSHIRYGLGDWIAAAVREHQRAQPGRSRRQAGLGAKRSSENTG